MYPTTPTAVTARGKAAAVKKSKITKMDTVVIEGISRVQFVEAILMVHGLSEKFSPGVHSGPSFKVWWNGARYVYISPGFKLKLT